MKLHSGNSNADVTIGRPRSERVMLGGAILPRKWLAHGPSHDSDDFLSWPLGATKPSS